MLTRAFTILLLLLSLSPRTTQATIIFSVDYEDGTFGNVTTRPPPKSGYPSIAYQPPSTRSVQILNAPGLPGNKAARMQLSPTDEGFQYSEYHPAPYVRAEFETGTWPYLGQTQWYALSTYIDPAYQSTLNDPNGTMFTQLFVIKDGCDFDQGHTIALRLRDDGTWRWDNTSEVKDCAQSSADVVKKKYNGGAAPKGVWTSWVINVKWSIQADGFLKIWKDGNLIVNVTGPNAKNNTAKMLWKWGIYKSWWNQQTPSASDKLIVYVDNVKRGDASSSFAEMTQGNPPPLPLAPGNLMVN